MPDIDIHKYAQRIESVKTLVKKSKTSRNKNWRYRLAPDKTYHL
jgi:hypothetical protein